MSTSNKKLGAETIRSGERVTLVFKRFGEVGYGIGYRVAGEIWNDPGVQDSAHLATGYDGIIRDGGDTYDDAYDPDYTRA